MRVGFKGGDGGAGRLRDWGRAPLVLAVRAAEGTKEGEATLRGRDTWEGALELDEGMA